MIDNTTLKIAVVTDDGSTIHRHFGRAQYYVIYTIEDGKVLSKQQVDKPHHHNHGHHHEPNVIQVGADHDHHDADRHRDMLQPLHGCQVLLTRGMGRGAFNGLQHIQVEPIITSIGNIDAAIQAYLTGQLDNHLEKLH